MKSKYEKRPPPPIAQAEGIYQDAVSNPQPSTDFISPSLPPPRSLNQTGSTTSRGSTRPLPPTPSNNDDDVPDEEYDELDEEGEKQNYIEQTRDDDQLPQLRQPRHTILAARHLSQLEEDYVDLPDEEEGLSDTTYEAMPADSTDRQRHSYQENSPTSRENPTGFQKPQHHEKQGGLRRRTEQIYPPSSYETDDVKSNDLKRSIKDNLGKQIISGLDTTKIKTKLSQLRPSLPPDGYKSLDQPSVKQEEQPCVDKLTIAERRTLFESKSSGQLGGTFEKSKPTPSRPKSYQPSTPDHETNIKPLYNYGFSAEGQGQVQGQKSRKSNVDLLGQDTRQIYQDASSLNYKGQRASSDMTPIHYSDALSVQGRNSRSSYSGNNEEHVESIYMDASSIINPIISEEVGSVYSDASSSVIKTSSNPSKITNDHDDLDLVSCPWYYGGIPRQLCETKLKQLNTEGAFVIRRSKQGSSHPYTLSFFHDGEIFNVIIRRKADQQFAIGSEKTGEPVFKDVADLITYYKSHPIDVVAKKSRNSLGGTVYLTSIHPSKD